MSRTVRPAVHFLLVTALLVGVVSGAPLAAADDDDDTVVATNGTNLELGGPKGINLGTDGVSLGGDSGIALEPGDGVSVGGESGVHAEVGEGVSVGGESGIHAEVGEGVSVGGESGVHAEVGEGVSVGGESGIHAEVGEGVSVANGSVLSAGRDGVTVLEQGYEADSGLTVGESPVRTGNGSLALGGSEGISLGRDGIAVGGDDGVAVGVSEGVSVGGESGIHAEVGEGVSVGGDDGVTAEVGEGIRVGGDEGITVGLTDGLRIGGDDGLRLSASSSGVGDLGYDLESVDSTDFDAGAVNQSNASVVTATPIAGENGELDPVGPAPADRPDTAGAPTGRLDTATPATEQSGTETSTATTDRAAGAVPSGFDGELPVSPEGAAAGGAATAALLGAAGIAARQTSMVGGTGTGTAAARAASTAIATGDGRLARMLSLFRYSRYDDSDPLELDARRYVYEAISDQPGEPITAVSDRADVNLSTARHHVKVLEREGLVATARVRNCERFYPAGTDDLELAAAMADECTADILDALVRLEPASVSGLAEAVDRSPATVTHHLQKLEDDDIVVRERNGRSVENKLSAAARAALDPETERRRHAAERKLEADGAEPNTGGDTVSGAQAD